MSAADTCRSLRVNSSPCNDKMEIDPKKSGESFDLSASSAFQLSMLFFINTFLISTFFLSTFFLSTFWKWWLYHQHDFCGIASGRSIPYLANRLLRLSDTTSLCPQNLPSVLIFSAAALCIWFLHNRGTETKGPSLYFLPQHFLYFFPEPQGQGSLGYTFCIFFTGLFRDKALCCSASSFGV